MAQKIVSLYTDDVSGETLEADEVETITFALDGVTYELDLGAANAEALRESFARYIEAGRRIGGRRTAGSPAKQTKTEVVDTKAVRVWAESNGVEVPSRGRIPKSVIVQFQEAQAQ